MNPSGSSPEKSPVGVNPSTLSDSTILVIFFVASSFACSRSLRTFAFLYFSISFEEYTSPIVVPVFGRWIVAVSCISNVPIFFMIIVLISTESSTYSLDRDLFVHLSHSQFQYFAPITFFGKATSSLMMIVLLAITAITTVIITIKENLSARTIDSSQ